jgi:hypothetical protein
MTLAGTDVMESDFRHSLPEPSDCLNVPTNHRHAREPGWTDTKIRKLIDPVYDAIPTSRRRGLVTRPSMAKCCERFGRLATGLNDTLQKVGARTVVEHDFFEGHKQLSYVTGFTE